MEWHVERSPYSNFIAETRELRLENGQLARIWHRHGAFRVERTGKHFRGTIEKLLPSRMYNFRVRGLDDQGNPASTVFEASITTYPPVSRASRSKWTTILVISAVGLVLFAWWKRVKSSASPAFDPKKTQRFY